MKTDDAFHDYPPEITLPKFKFFRQKVKLRPFSERVSVLVNKLISKVEDSTDFSAIGAYVLVSQCEAREASKLVESISGNHQLESAVFGLSDDDFEAVKDYIERVIERRNAAQFSIEEKATPGKPTPARP